MSDRARKAFSAAAMVLALVSGIRGAGAADRAPGGTPAPLPPLPALLETDTVAVETVIFRNKEPTAVRVVRGATAPPSPTHAAAATVPVPVKPAPALPIAVRAPATPIPSPRREIVSFGSGFADQVIVVRGSAAPPALQARPIPAAAQARVENVAFSDPRHSPVKVVRGEVGGDMFFSIGPAVTGLFDAAEGGELDRVAFAVDGVESSHGTNPRMWRPEFHGPQGPMQVSAAAALDVGGGDRFDIDQNRRLGRAYLAQMFQRYGNWPDAIAAYNWGPGNMDRWITGGRNTEKLPIDVIRYTNRVLRDALLVGRARL
jgi:hypothetical protein